MRNVMKTNTKQMSIRLPLNRFDISDICQAASRQISKNDSYRDFLNCDLPVRLENALDILKIPYLWVLSTKDISGASEHVIFGLESFMALRQIKAILKNLYKADSENQISSGNLIKSPKKESQVVPL